MRNEHVNLGLAVDVEKDDGTRTLLVPNVKDADTLDFAEFLAAYEDLIRKVKTNKLRSTTSKGATVTLTNPGTIGTVLGAAADAGPGGHRRRRARSTTRRSTRAPTPHARGARRSAR